MAPSRRIRWKATVPIVLAPMTEEGLHHLMNLNLNRTLCLRLAYFFTSHTVSLALKVFLALYSLATTKHVKYCWQMYLFL